MKRRTTLVAVLGALASAAAVVAAPPALAAVPPASVRVVGPGALGRSDSDAVVPLQERCKVGWQSRDVVVTVTQGGVTGTLTQAAGIPCDGTWHDVRLSVSSAGPEFSVGGSHVTAKLTAHNPSDGANRTASTSSFLNLLEQSEIRLGTAPVRMGSGGVPRVPVRLRCQVPWVVSELLVTVSQNDGALTRTQPLSAGDSRLVCDGEWHRFVVYVGRPRDDDYFFFGPARVDLAVDVQDPVSFDPVDQATFTGMTTIQQDD
jgi:hypothetical protein